MEVAEILKGLPPLATVAFGIAMALIYVVANMGIKAGRKGVDAPGVASAPATVAAVIVDPAALNRSSEAALKLASEISDLTDAMSRLTIEIARRK